MMKSEELSKRLEKLEKQMGYALGNQVSILETQEKLLGKLSEFHRKPTKQNEFSIILNYFLMSLVFYGLIHAG